ncbi:DNA topoisomerase [Thiovibrio frasassiensis]|uniref:DNA topoisomerase n=1 Tax=Thiovibrio frasassiensis TaxID=2984131 RepID=A0A9X4MBY7_9BACT|nr:DNA topoisomerase [Thiovibrio frasassiensis]MDG4474779.1 DNA topoisomerase [Thiovibrio frasassiensis]
MAKSVVIVESAAKAETLAEQLGGEVEPILVLAAPARATYLPPKDHMRREKPHFDFGPEAKEKIFLDKLFACQGREIYLALDGDWRGEFWAWLISGYWAMVAPGSKQPKRVGLVGLAGEALRESFRRVEPVSEEKGAATYIKMIFESYLGKHLQRLLGSRTGPSGLPLNHPSLTTLFLLAERETEIRMFTPLAKWKVKVKISSEAGECALALQEAYGVTDDGFLRNEKEVHTAINLFNNASFQVREVARSPLAVAPPSPYHFLELLRDGVAQGGLSPLAAMTAIRNLYYGVKVDGRRLGLVTAFLPPAMAQESFAAVFVQIRAQIAQRLGDSCLGPETGQQTTRGLILPTLPELGPEELAGKIGGAEEKIYRLVWARALASQMKEAQGELLAVTVEGGEDCIFQGNAKVLSDKGFLAIYPGCQEHELLAPPSPLAEVKAGQPLHCVQIIPEKNTGHPPEYYSFEGLATDLADFSLEIDGMTVAMLQQMLDNNYLRMMPDGSFRCAENTAKLLSVMNRAFPTMKGIQLSAYLAQTIEEAVSGRKLLTSGLQQFDQTMMMRGEVLVKMAMPVATQKRGISSRSVIRLPEEAEPAKVQDSGGGVPGQAEKATEPSIAEPLVEAASLEPPESASVKEGAISESAAEVAETGEGAAVSSGPETVEPQGDEAVSAQEESQEPIVLDEPAVAEEVVSPELAAATEKMFAEAATSMDEPLPPPPGEALLVEPASAQAEPGKPCPDCGRVLLLKEDRFGKYWYCSGHPECRHSASYEKDGAPSLLCPVCRTGTVVTKHTPTGKIFYVCPEQDCEFMAWSKPHAIACQVCDSPFLVEKKSLDGRLSLRCPKAGCTFTRPLSGTAGAAPEPGAAPQKKKVLVRRVAPGSGGAGGATKKVRIVRRKK